MGGTCTAWWHSSGFGVGSATRGIWPVAQTSVAAGLAWYLTHSVLGHAQPFFAPIAAAVSLSATTVLRSQRALQLITGVALGIGVGVGVAAVAEGPVAIGVAVLIAMSAALAAGGGFFGHGLMFVNQTAGSAILIIALHRSGSGSERLVDALVGGGVVLMISLLIFPAAPLRLIDRATQNLGIALREALSQLDEQITRREPAAASCGRRARRARHRHRRGRRDGGIGTAPGAAATARRSYLHTPGQLARQRLRPRCAAHSRLQRRCISEMGDHSGWEARGATMGVTRQPIWSISTSTVSPGCKNRGGRRVNPTPSGVPVAITSPGHSVKQPDA